MHFLSYVYFKAGEDSKSSGQDAPELPLDSADPAGAAAEHPELEGRFSLFCVWRGCMFWKVYY